MTKTEITKRYFLLFLGMVVISFGVAFITKANLGTSPIAAIPYTLSLIFPILSFGTWLIIFALSLVVGEIIVLKGRVIWSEIWVQVLISFIFGSFVDVAMFCLKGLHISSYLTSVGFLLLGCLTLAIGAYLEIIANVAMLPIDALERALSTVIGKEYSTIRTIADILMTLIAATLCLAVLHNLAGVREGTIIAAIISGPIIRFLVRKLKFKL